VQQVFDGMTFVTETTEALMGDPQYALLNAKRASDMVIDVVTGAELLLQAQYADVKVDVAGSFIRRHIPSVEMNARRIRSGDATRIKRYDRILGNRRLSEHAGIPYALIEPVGADGRHRG
jgi:hypothetical protein